MKITLVTCGSRGDVQPMLALALALKAKGHEVKLIAPPENTGWINEYGCRFQPLGADAMGVIMNRTHVHSFKSAIDFLLYIYNELKTQLDQLPDMIMESDLVLGTGLSLGLPAVAESFDIPYRFIAFTPHLFPSKDHPFLVVREHWLPPAINQFTWSLANCLDRFFLRARLNYWRRLKGLKPAHNQMVHLLGKHPVVACDPELATVPADVDRDYSQTGYMHLRQSYSKNQELDRFIDSGSPPVFVGFGSMQGRDQKEVMALIIEAIQSTGKRLIVSHSRNHADTIQINKDCLFIRNLPHMQFFPRLEAIIHHGGSGTTATAALAGIPQIIIPHVLDQFYWAERIRRLGLGPTPIWRSRLTKKRLAEAVTEACSNQDMKAKAKLISQSIQKQDNIELTVKHIESIIN